MGVDNVESYFEDLKIVEVNFQISEAPNSIFVMRSLLYIKHCTRISEHLRTGFVIEDSPSGTAVASGIRSSSPPSG